MRILLTRTSDDRHDLEVVRDDGSRDGVKGLESKSVLMHDLLHLAVESEAHLTTGFWGNLAGGTTLAQLNDRTGAAMMAETGELGLIEQIVGAMSGAVKGRSAAEMMESFRNFALAQGTPLPDWLTQEFISRVQERMRKLIGHWNATPYGGVMEVEW